MDRRVSIIRCWLLIGAVALLGLAYHPGAWFCFAPILAPVIFLKNGKVLMRDGQIIIGDSSQDCEDCCEGCSVTCTTRCLNDKASCRYEITITGVGGTCNGTFLTQVGGGGPTNCTWSGTGACGGILWPIFQISSPSAGTRRYTVAASGQPASFLKDIAGGDGSTCMNLNESLPPTAGAPPAATCQVVSVAT